MKKYTLYWNITIYPFSSSWLSYLYNMNEKFLFILFKCITIYFFYYIEKNCYKILTNCMRNIHIIYIESLSTNLIETNLHIFTYNMDTDKQTHLKIRE